jgi:hypothetical protein
MNIGDEVRRLQVVPIRHDVRETPEPKNPVKAPEREKEPA